MFHPRRAHRCGFDLEDQPSQRDKDARQVAVLRMLLQLRPHQRPEMAQGRLGSHAPMRPPARRAARRGTPAAPQPTVPTALATRTASPANQQGRGGRHRSGRHGRACRRSQNVFWCYSGCYSGGECHWWRHPRSADLAGGQRLGVQADNLLFVPLHPSRVPERGVRVEPPGMVPWHVLAHQTHLGLHRPGRRFPPFSCPRCSPICASCAAGRTVLVTSASSPPGPTSDTPPPRPICQLPAERRPGGGRASGLAGHTFGPIFG
jgi:hypothetical protein